MILSRHYLVCLSNPKKIAKMQKCKDAKMQNQIEKMQVWMMP